MTWVSDFHTFFRTPKKWFRQSSTRSLVGTQFADVLDSGDILFHSTFLLKSKRVVLSVVYLWWCSIPAQILDGVSILTLTYSYVRDQDFLIARVQIKGPPIKTIWSEELVTLGSLVSGGFTYGRYLCPLGAFESILGCVKRKPQSRSPRGRSISVGGVWSKEACICKKHSLFKQATENFDHGIQNGDRLEYTNWEAREWTPWKKNILYFAGKKFWFFRIHGKRLKWVK